MAFALRREHTNPSPCPMRVLATLHHPYRCPLWLFAIRRDNLDGISTRLGYKADKKRDRAIYSPVGGKAQGQNKM